MNIANFTKNIDAVEQAVIINFKTGQKISTDETNGFKLFESLKDSDLSLIFPASEINPNRTSIFDKTR